MVIVKLILLWRLALVPDDSTADMWQLLAECMQPGMFLSEAEVLWVFLNYLR